MQGEEIWVDTGAGPEMVPLPDDLPLVAPDPPPAELLHTAYDMWHSTGADLVVYTRLYAAFRDPRRSGSRWPTIRLRPRSSTALRVRR